MHSSMPESAAFLLRMFAISRPGKFRRCTAIRLGYPDSSLPAPTWSSTCCSRPAIPIANLFAQWITPGAILPSRVSMPRSHALRQQSTRIIAVMISHTSRTRLSVLTVGRSQMPCSTKPFRRSFHTTEQSQKAPNGASCRRSVRECNERNPANPLASLFPGVTGGNCARAPGFRLPRRGHGVVSGEAEPGKQDIAVEKRIVGIQRQIVAATYLHLTAGAWSRLRRAWRLPVTPGLLRQAYLYGPVRSVVAAFQSFVVGSGPIREADAIFVLGFWRSGTTLMHELLSQDQRFCFPSNYAAFHPHHFVFTGKAALARGDKEIRRPQDGMTTGWGTPQEDEFALLALGARSPYEGLIAAADF